MVAAPAAADAVRRARRLPGLRVGLHLVLADGVTALPAAEVPALADPTGHMDGNMLMRGVRYFALAAVRRQLEAEIRAQFAAFAASGLTLDHVNVHKHFHLHPTILDLLLHVGRDYGLGAVRVPQEPLWFARAYGGPLAVPGAALLRPWITLLKRRLRRAGVFYNDRVFGIAASGAMQEATLLEVVARLPGGVTEIYLHPAVRSGADIAPSMLGYRHADELAALLSPRVRAAIAASRAATGGFREAAGTS